MKKTMWMSMVSVVLFCLSQAGATVTYYGISRLGLTDPNTGNAYFKGAYEVNGIVNNDPCSDCISATQSEGEGGMASLIWQVKPADGMKVSSLSVGLDFQGDATNSGHIQVSYSTAPDGPWTQIVDAYVPGSYVWYNQTTTASVSGEADIYYVKCAVLPSWTNHAGNSNMWWRGFTLAGEETAVPEPVSMVLLGIGTVGIMLRRRK
jgi:hypothetical protein